MKSSSSACCRPFYVSLFVSVPFTGHTSSTVRDQAFETKFSFYWKETSPQAVNMVMQLILKCDAFIVNVLVVHRPTITEPC